MTNAVASSVKKSGFATSSARLEAGPRRLDNIRTGTMSVNAALLEALRADLLNGQVAAGIKLKIPDLCERYAVSPGAVREALSRLVAEGLVDFADQRGFRSTAISLDSLRDITRVRLLIEREALLDSMRHGDAKWESEVLAAEHRLSREDAEGDLATSPHLWASRHKDFHLALVGACRSPWLIKLHNLLYDQTERYRMISAAVGSSAPQDGRNVRNEHRDLAAAVIAREENLAAALMEAHLLITMKRVEKMISGAP